MIIIKEPVPEQDELKEEPSEAEEKDVFDDVLIGGKDSIVIKTEDSENNKDDNKSAKSDDDKSAKDDDISREDDAKTPTPQVAMFVLWKNLK